MTVSSPSIGGRDFDVFVQTLERFGGGWVRQFAALLRCSDPVRRQRLIAAFPEQLEKYGPGTVFFQETSDQREQEPRIAQWITVAPHTEDCIPF
jgi:hypothetical protein